jgi:hypothetical protein
MQRASRIGLQAKRQGIGQKEKEKEKQKHRQRQSEGEDNQKGGCACRQCHQEKDKDASGKGTCKTKTRRRCRCCPICPPGAVGPQGVIGPIGPQGPSQGAQGFQGTQGLNGVQGLEGPQGPQGLGGVQGQTGLQGPQAAAGAGAIIDFMAAIPALVGTAVPTSALIRWGSSGDPALAFPLAVGASPLAVGITNSALGPRTVSSPVLTLGLSNVTLVTPPAVLELKLFVGPAAGPYVDSGLSATVNLISNSGSLTVLQSTNGAGSAIVPAGDEMIAVLEQTGGALAALGGSAEGTFNLT